MKASLQFLALLVSTSIFSACSTPKVLLPRTNSTYTVGAEGSGTMTGVETIEFRGDWVLLDGRRLIPKEKIQFIRADRGTPSEIKSRNPTR